MPSPRVLNFGPDPMAEALKGFGSGFSQQFVQNDERNRDDDMIGKIINAIDPSMEPKDVLQTIMRGQGVSLQNKIKLASAYDENRLSQAKLNASLKEEKNNELKIKKEEVQHQRNLDQVQLLIKAGLPEQFAQLWVNSGPGAQTELMKMLSEQAKWDPNSQKILNTLIGSATEADVNQVNPADVPANDVNVLDNGVEKEITTPTEATTPNATRPTKQVIPRVKENYLPPDKAAARDQDRYKTGLPLFQNVEQRMAATANDALSIKNLTTLNESGELEKGIPYFNKNPFTGDLLIPALASPEEQLYQKTVNEFVSRAKEWFGSRVTNFDVQTFKARLPMLGNTAEGRAAILKEMSLANELIASEDKALMDVIDEHGGIRNIDWDQAVRIAHKLNEPNRERIEKEIKDLNSVLKYDDKETIRVLKEKTPNDQVLFRKPDGKFTRIPAKQAKRAEAKGYKRV